MKILITILLSFIIYLNSVAQEFNRYVADDDTLTGVLHHECNSKSGRNLIGTANMNYNDSLKCLIIEHIPIQNSNKVLCIERNYFGDTLGIGFKKEIIVNKHLSSFFIRNGDRLNATNTTYGEKIEEWFYYYPDGKLKEKKKY